MSIHRMTEVWAHSPYSGSALLIHLALADYADEDGICYPRKATLAEKARCTEETARTVLLRMIQDGEIEVLEEAGRGPGARAGRYRLIPKYSGSLPNDPNLRDERPKSARNSPYIGTVIEPSLSSSRSDERELALQAAKKFWERYPNVHGRKRQKDKTLAKFVALCAQGKLGQLRDGFKFWERQWRDPENLKYAPAPLVWLNKGYWEPDAIDEGRAAQPSSWLLEQGRMEVDEEILAAPVPDWI